MDKQNHDKQPKKQTKDQEPLTKPDFFKALDKVIQTTKQPSAKEKSKTSE